MLVVMEFSLFAEVGGVFGTTGGKLAGGKLAALKTNWVKKS